MKWYNLILSLFTIVCSCNSSTDDAATVTTIENARLDSSAIINDSTRLPVDSTNTGVQH